MNCNFRKRKVCEFAVTYMEKLVKSIWVNLFSAGFSLLERGGDDGSRPPVQCGLYGWPRSAPAPEAAELALTGLWSSADLEAVRWLTRMLAKSKANFVVGLIRLVSKVMKVESVNFCDHFVQKILQNIGKNNNTRTVQTELSKFASVSFDQGFQIWVGWNWSEHHLTVFCIDPIVPCFVVYYVNT